MQAIDALRAIWIIAVFLCVFIAFPAYIFPVREPSTTVARTAGNFVRSLFLVTLVGLVLTKLRIFNVTTLVVLLVGALLFAWVRKHSKISRDWLRGLQDFTIGVVRLTEGQSPSGPTRANVSRQWRAPRWYTAFEGKGAISAAFVVVLIAIAVLYFAHPLRELRLSQPEDYESLLRGRELMVNLQGTQRPLIFPAVIATIAFLSSMDPVQVTRFLAPLLELGVILAAGLVVRVCTRGIVAVMVAIYLLGTAAFQPTGSEGVVPISMLEKLEFVLGSSLARIHGSPEWEIGLLCLLLALAFLAGWREDSLQRGLLADIACCVILLGMVSQFLLFLCVMAAAVVLLRPILGIIVFVLMCYGLALYRLLSVGIAIPNEAQLILPLATALGIACLLGLLETKLITPNGKTAEQLLLVACAAGAVLWSHPRSVASQYLEYEKAARETQEIASQFPKQRWSVVAPTEQLAETLGSGGYEDLAEFVEKYQDQAPDSRFAIPDAPDDLFVYVEKKPFQIFSSEPAVVSLVVLADTTYRSYRSPAGRASLEEAALRLCEAYRRSHSDIDIFFEDEALRIYHIRRQSAVTTGKGG
jgi:hypothetical protein